MNHLKIFHESSNNDNNLQSNPFNNSEKPHWFSDAVRSYIIVTKIQTISRQKQNNK